MDERSRFEHELARVGAGADAVSEYESPAARKEMCRQRWFAIRDTLPAAVLTALDERRFPLAVGLAIHSGVRDANLLTNMVFFASYGDDRGYCPLVRAEKSYIAVWLDMRNTLVRPRLAVPSPPVPQSGGILCVARKDRRVAEPAPDNPGLDITGRYEHKVLSSVAPGFTFRVNQAGNHVEAVLTTVILPSGKPNRRDVHRFHGDLQRDGTFLMFSRSNPDVRALLRRNAQTGTVSLDSTALRGTSVVDQLELAESGPTLMENAISSLPAGGALVKHHEWYPLTRAQVQHIRSGLSPARLDPLLKKYFDTPAGDRVHERIARRTAARPLDDYIFKLFSNRAVGIHPLDVPLARFYARTLLSQSRWKRTLTRSHLDWIQIMISMVARDDHKNDFGSIQNYLGVHPSPSPSAGDPAARLHSYKVTLKLDGGGPFVQGYKGTITFEKTNEPFWAGRKTTFGIWLLGLTSGIGISAGDEIEGSATTSLAWQPPDIPGTVSMVKGGVSVPGVEANAGFLHVYGSEIHPPMQVLFSGAGFKPAPREGKGSLSITPELGGSWGKIQSKSLPDIDYTTVNIRTDHAVESQLTEDVHFCVDSAILTADARQALRIMCANELPALLAPTSRLTIHGHTDRSDTASRNLTLSAMRAANVLQAIEDILGRPPAMSGPQLVVAGQGENEALKAGEPDNKRNPKYRRVDIILNGRLVLTLKAQ